MKQVQKNEDHTSTMDKGNFEGKYIDSVLLVINKEKSIDFSGYDNTLIRKIIGQRTDQLPKITSANYAIYLAKNPKEIDLLLNDLTINVSWFFRDPLVFELLSINVLPLLFDEKENSRNNSVRIWSTACANGEEAYSIAILIKEYLSGIKMDVPVDFFATDIDKNALKNAEIGSYKREKLQETKLSILTRYFEENTGQYSIHPDIKKMVRFSYFNLLSPKPSSPPGSVFGNFDLIICRNVLIYYDTASQNAIFKKLFKSLASGGFLVLGESETIPSDYTSGFKQVNFYCKIYQKY